jgi:hypothetical protein
MEGTAGIQPQNGGRMNGTPADSQAGGMAMAGSQGGQDPAVQCQPQQGGPMTGGEGAVNSPGQGDAVEASCSCSEHETNAPAGSGQIPGNPGPSGPGGTNPGAHVACGHEWRAARITGGLASRQPAVFTGRHGNSLAFRGAVFPAWAGAVVLSRPGADGAATRGLSGPGTPTHIFTPLWGASQSTTVPALGSSRLRPTGTLWAACRSLHGPNGPSPGRRRLHGRGRTAFLS